MKASVAVMDHRLMVVERQCFFLAFDRYIIDLDRIAAIALPDDTFDYRKSTSTFASNREESLRIED